MASPVEGLLLPMEETRIRSLALDNVTMAHHELELLSRSSSSWSCIKQLYLDGVRCSEHRDRSCIPVLDLRKYNELERLSIMVSPVEGLLLPIEKTRIRSLALDNVTMAHHELELLSRSSSSWSCIKQLHLDGVRSSENRDRSCIPVLNLRKYNELELLRIMASPFEGLLLSMEGTRIRQLFLDNVTMAHHELEQLSRSSSSWSCIKQLHLDGMRCSEHRDRCCIPVLDLRKHNELERLSIKVLPVESLLLPMEGTRIRQLALDNVTMAHHELEQLSRSSSSWSSIKQLHLDGVRCSEHRDRSCIPVLDLRKHNELELLFIKASPVEDLLLPMEGTRIRELALDNVTMAHHELEQLSRPSSSWSSIKQLHLDGVRCSEHRDRCCIPVLDLRKHNELELLSIKASPVEDLLLPIEGARIRQLTLVNLTMAHHELEQLSRSSPSWSSIKLLTLDGVRCSEHRDRSCIPVLDLGEHNELELLRINASPVEGLLLPIEGARIRSLILVNVTMAHHELEQLSLSSSSWSSIEQLHLDGVRCSEHRDRSCIPVLDLRKYNELVQLGIKASPFEGLLLPMEGTRIRQLFLINVTMAHHELEQLSRSSSSWSCIKQLHLDGVRCSEHRDRCCIPVLDLRKHNELERLSIKVSPVESLLLPMEGTRIRQLTLDNVTMAHHELKQLSRSSSSWSSIELLRLDGVICSEHRDRSCIPVLDLRKNNELKLLYIKALPVEGLLLPMEGTRIRQLTLDNVTMAHHELKQLSRSSSSWSSIELLRLDGVICSEHRDRSCIPVLDLRKNNELKLLYIKALPVEGLLLPMEGTRIRALNLVNVTMAHHELEQLSISSSSWSSIELLWLDGVRCSEHRDRSCIPVLDLRKYNELVQLGIKASPFEGLLLPMEGTRIRQLFLINVTMAHHELEQLSRSSSSWSSIEQLYLDGVRCSEHRDRSCIPVLDLRKYNELKLLYLKALPVEDLLLPMEGARIRQLFLDNVTMAHHELELLSRSSSSWSCIKQLHLDGVRCNEHRDRCCIPVLDLRKHNELEQLSIMASPVEGLLLPMEETRIRSLALDNVTMAHHELEQLSRSSSSWSSIKQLHLDGVRCSEHRDRSCIPVLDLRKHNELELLSIKASPVEDLLLPIEGARIRQLTLVNLTMAHHELEQLSRSSSSWSSIKLLTLDGVRCSEHRDRSCIPVLDLGEHNELELLRINASPVEGLLLPIEGARIRSLILVNVTMAHHELEQLSLSSSSWSSIEQLHLDGVRCSEHRDRSCIPVLDLRKNN